MFVLVCRCTVALSHSAFLDRNDQKYDSKSVNMSSDLEWLLLRVRCVYALIPPAVCADRPANFRRKAMLTS